MEKPLIRQRFSRALDTYDRHAVAQQHICRRLASLLRGWLAPSSAPRILEVGCGTGGFTRELLASCRGLALSPSEWVVNDLCDACRTSVADILQGEPWTYLPGDAEQLDFPGTYDLIASASALQWFDRPDAFIRKATRMLPAGGVLLFNTFGPSNLQEIKELTGKGLLYPSEEEVKGWFPPSLKVAEWEAEELTLRFPSPADVLRHLKYTGVTATGTAFWTPGRLQRFCRDYAERFSHGKDVVLTYQPLYVLAIKQ